MSYLRAVGEVSDQGGLASAALAEAVGYPGSSLAFAQLLSSMERSGLIEREVRGRRTYRITLAPAAAGPARDREPGASGRPADQAEPAALARSAVPGVPARTMAPRATAAREAGRQAPRGPEPGAIVGLDYDELAGRLLTEVVHRLAWASESAWVGDLAGTVASLERRLASVEAQQRALRTENTRLREQLAATRQSLAEQSLTAARDTGAHLNRLDTGAVQLLERLLASLRSEERRDDAARGQSAEVG
jgi:hypothetical protein